MKKVIYKYKLCPPFGHESSVTHEIPLGYKILSVGLDTHDELCVWVEVNPDPLVYKTEVEFCTFGTGNSFQDTNLTFIGTIRVIPYMWHIYYRQLG